jgi:hypothetical protein
MRCLFVVIALSACTPHPSTGPAWPKPFADKDAKDGGESLAPQESRQVAVAVEKSSEDTKPAAAAESKPVATAAAPEVGAGPAVAPPVIDETIMTEDIIIEIDD